MEIIKALIFLTSLILTVYFHGKLFSWAVHEISRNEDNKMTQREINLASICMLFACIGWTTLYYLSL